MKYVIALSASMLLAATGAHAEDVRWGAKISVDGRTTVDVVDATQTGCNTQVAQYGEVVVMQPCQPVDATRADSGSIGTGTALSPIQDNGDGGRGNGVRSGRPRH